MSEFKEEIYNKFRERYEKISYQQFDQVPFDEFVDEITNELQITEGKNFSKNYLLVKTIRPTKKRWIKIVTNDKKSLYNKEIESAEIFYDKVKSGELPSSKFESFFGVSNIDEYRETLLKELKKWANDDNAFLTDFKYLDSLINRSVMIAIKNDIYLYYFIFSEKQKVNITKVPKILSELPIDTSGKIDYLSESQKNNLDEDLDINIVPTLDKLISLEGDEKDEILLRLEKKTYLEIKKGGNPDKFLDMMTQIALLKSIKYLNSFDTKIINYYYNHFENALTGKPINKTIYEIRKELNLPVSQKYYEDIENSLAKIGSMNMTYNLNGSKLYGNLLSCVIYEENGVKKARVYLGDILKELVIKDGSFEYDKDVFNNLSNMSQQLAIWLQKRRYGLALGKSGNIDSIETKTFTNAIYFKTKRVDRIRNRIIECLEELQLKNLIVKEYYLNKKIDVIVIHYIDLTIKERKKLGLLDDDMLVESKQLKEINNAKFIV
ncbi:hypothetical protein OD350_29240 (plasmid) [Clostridium beijerinckii]|uniref:hypothetical protein n=1 Tax=Clostridium beijerinckii TaxID=1520 RepID=UPI0022272DBB|nr:hypothetical protein [Clostridium beijerinckii]UYZ38974.1 hypothetical protein OD350_29240 [Clostridium beijerinckii]